MFDFYPWEIKLIIEKCKYNHLTSFSSYMSLNSVWTNGI